MDQDDFIQANYLDRDHLISFRFRIGLDPHGTKGIPTMWFFFVFGQISTSANISHVYSLNQQLQLCAEED